MIDNNKLLSRDRVATGRNVVTIKRNLIKIDSLLKERLVLVKVRQGILRQQEQNRMRRQREDNLESLQSTSVQGDSPDKQGSNFLSGIIKSILGLSGIFLPQLLRLLNFLKRIVDPIKNMATATFKALSSFLKVGTMAVDKISDAFNFKGSTLKGLDETTITNKFNKFEFALNTFVNALLFAGAMQTLSNLPDIKLVQNFLKKFKKLPVTTGNQIPIDDKFLLKPAKAAANVIEQIFDLRNLQKPIETYSIPLTKKTPVKPKIERVTLGNQIPFVQPPRSAQQLTLIEQILNESGRATTGQFFDFLRINKVPQPEALFNEATKIFDLELANVTAMYESGNIPYEAFQKAGRELDLKYTTTLKEVSQYSKEVNELFFKSGGLKAPVQNLFDYNMFSETRYKGFPIESGIFVPKSGDNILRFNKRKSKRFADYDKSLETLNKKIKNLKSGDRTIGAAARSMFPTTMPDLIYPSMFERGRSALFETGEFLKGIDQTMVDFATRQTGRVSKVIMSGPLKGLQEGAEKMLKRAVGETIGLIPFLGDLVGLLLDIYLFGEIPERAGYKAVGGILGGFVGALIGSFPPLIPFGGPIIGSIIGGIGGDILGGFVYDMVKGKQASVSKQDTGESIGKTTTKSTIKEQAIKAGLITFGKGGFTGKGDSRQLAGLVHHNEQVFDPDTTLAVRQNAPGFFEDLNRAKGFESLEVLRNFASYEGTQTAMAHFIPIPIPMPRKEVPPVIDMATGEVREDLVSSYHYARG